MRRCICLGILTIVGVFATMTTYEARQERASLTAYEIADNLYMLANASSVQGMGGGGNTAIFVTNDGVTLVDTKIRGYGQDILAEVRTITDKPVTTIINTHTHWDHTGTNTEFPDTVDFVVHENTRAHMASDECDDGAGFQGGSIKNCDAFKGADARYLPKTTYSDTLTLFSGADQIDLYHFGRGHTDGDTFVVFRAARAMHTGDMFQRLGLPFMDDVLDSAAADFPALAALRAHDLPYDSRSSFSLWLNARDTYTGITDRDRARTVSAFSELVAAELEPDAAQLLLGERFRSPGHVPVCVAHPDGLVGRQGHTELMVSLVAMAGLPPVALGCEMLADEGGRLPPEAAVAWAEAGGHPFLEGHEIVAAWVASA